MKHDAWIIHNGSIICDVSKKALIMFRCESADLLGLNIFEIIPNPEMRALARLRVSHILERGELHEQELPLARPDGSVFWVRVKTRILGGGLLVSFLNYIGDNNPNFKGT